MDENLAPLNPGERGRYYCGDCCTEYELVLEPRARGKEGLPAQAPKNCPFCQSYCVEEA